MASSDIKNEPLGLKHKNYNKCLENAISKNKLEEKEFKPVAKDLDNLIKIDIASKNKYVDYILSVLKSNDLLYVSRALKNSEWLVEDKYKDIINPRNLKEHLLPQMTAEAGIKLIKLIRKNLKDESRAEEFFTSEESPIVAAKWLSRCSIPFIEKHVQTHLAHLTKLELKRLCEKSVTIFDAAVKDNEYGSRPVIEAASFLLNTHVDKYLDAVEKTFYNLNAKSTNTIMKQVPDRIKNKFDEYFKRIHIPTFVKYFKSEEIKGFLYQQINADAKEPRYINRKFFKFPTMKEFIQRMPADEQFDFVKELFINKSYLLLEDNNDPVAKGTEKYSACLFSESVCAVNPTYVWYEFAPFDTAFAEIKKLRSESNDSDKSAALKVLLLCAKGDKARVQTVLSYFVSELHKEGIREKHEFVTNLIDNTDIVMICHDEDLWVLLDKILVSMDFYKENDTTLQNCLEIVILHNVLKNKPIPEIVVKKVHSTLKDYRKKLSKEDGDRVFEYLLKLAKKAIDNTQISDQETFNGAISVLDELFNLLLDWKKEMNDYPFILEKIQSCLKLAKENNWKKSNLSKIYNKNKSWRKLMFEESVMLHPSEAVCVNAIKHDPALLERYKDEVENIRCDDKESLVNLLKKLRIYWPNTLAEDWTNSYIVRLDKLGNHKALLRGLCSLLPQKELHEIIVKYAPVEHKVDWNNIDELTLGLQRTIAKNMHIARPKPIPEDVLLYAKGDYLQFALPSLHAIFYSLSRVDSKDKVPKLLDAPVSLQKHGLRLSFVKLDHDEHKLHMSNIWKTSKNSSIRKVVFQLVFERLIKEKKDKEAKELWELLEVFIDNLSFQEDDKIYKMLPRVNDVPSCVRANFLKKSYKFLKTLVPNIKKDRDTYQYHVDRLEECTRDIMESMPSDFVAEILTEFIDEKFFKYYDKYQSAISCSGGLTTVLSAYLLCAKEENTQMQRYEQLLSPLLKRSFTLWNDTNEGSFYIRRNVQSVLKCLSNDLVDYVVKNKMVTPTKMFGKILDELNKLPISENYLMVTKWKLTVKLAELVKKSNESDWEKISAEIGPEFGKICLEHLMGDVSEYFSCIYVLFSKAMSAPLQQFPVSIQMEIFGKMLSDKESVQAYLATLKMFPTYTNSCGLEAKTSELKEIMASHPSVEVKMHYKSVFYSSLYGS